MDCSLGHQQSCLYARLGSPSPCAALGGPHQCQHASRRMGRRDGALHLGSLVGCSGVSPASAFMSISREALHCRARRSHSAATRGKNRWSTSVDQQQSRRITPVTDLIILAGIRCSLMHSERDHTTSTRPSVYWYPLFGTLHAFSRDISHCGLQTVIVDCYGCSLVLRAGLCRRLSSI